MPRKEQLVFDAGKFKHPFLETSRFSVMFARHRLEYLRSVEGYIRKACEAKNVDYIVNYDDMTLEVATNGTTRDPYIIVKANDMIQLLSKGVPLEHAAGVLEDDVFSEIVPANLLCGNDSVFERRKNRLSNPKILRAIELLTKCRIFVSGKVVCIVGNYRGLNEAKNIVVLCFENVHPVFELKKLMIKHKLAKEGKEGNWDRYLPQVAKKHTSGRGVESTATGKMPGTLPPRNEDLERETGEYYANPDNLKKDASIEARRQKRNRIRQARIEGNIELGEE